MAVVSMSEVKVGALVLLAVGLVLALTLSVGNFQDYFSHSLTIHITIPSVVGLENFSPITYSGVRIGTVTNLRYDEDLDKAVIEAKINFDSPVSQDSKVQFTSAGLLSPLFIEITGGSKDQRIRDLVKSGKLDAHQIYLSADPYLSFADIFAVAGDLKAVLKQVEAMLSDVSGLPREIAGFVHDVSGETQVILHEIQGMLFDSRPRLKNALDGVDGLVFGASEQVIPALHDIRKSASDLPGFVGDTKQNLSDVMGKAGGLIDTVSPEVVAVSQRAVLLLDTMQQRIQALEETLSKVLKDVDGMVVNNQEDINRIVVHLERTAANLNEITNELKKNPWRIIWKTEEKLDPVRVSPQWNPIQAEKGNESKQ